MSTAAPRGVIEAPTISEAWLGALRLIAGKSADLGTPLTVSFTDFDDAGMPVEQRSIRHRLDAQLKARQAVAVATNAAMIFPLDSLRLMEMRLGRTVSAVELADYYVRFVYPRLRAQNAHANGRGTYFLRMIAYGRDPKDDAAAGFNQLQKLLSIWARRRGVVQSRLQLAIRDPQRDLNDNPRPFFPCLQQVSFAHDRGNGISVTGYYPTQYILDRAYGNYLGLAHLAWFIARSLQRHVVRVNCICAHPLLGAAAGSKHEALAAFTGL